MVGAVFCVSRQGVSAMRQSIPVAELLEMLGYDHADVVTPCIGPLPNGLTFNRYLQLQAGTPVAEGQSRLPEDLGELADWYVESTFRDKWREVGQTTRSVATFNRQRHKRGTDEVSGAAWLALEEGLMTAFGHPWWLGEAGRCASDVQFGLEALLSKSAELSLAFLTSEAAYRSVGLVTAIHVDNKRMTFHRTGRGQGAIAVTHFPRAMPAELDHGSIAHFIGRGHASSVRKMFKDSEAQNTRASILAMDITIVLRRWLSHWYDDLEIEVGENVGDPLLVNGEKYGEVVEIKINQDTGLPDPDGEVCRVVLITRDVKTHCFRTFEELPVVEAGQYFNLPRTYPGERLDKSIIEVSWDEPEGAWVKRMSVKSLSIMLGLLWILLVRRRGEREVSAEIEKRRELAVERQLAQEQAAAAEARAEAAEAALARMKAEQQAASERAKTSVFARIVGTSIPSSLASQVIAGKLVEAFTSQVAVMFVDTVGFSVLADDSAPDGLTAIESHRFTGVLMQAVKDYVRDHWRVGLTGPSDLGDGFMVYVLPQGGKLQAAHIDLLVRMAHKLNEWATRNPVQLKSGAWHHFQLRCGINAGSAAVGNTQNAEGTHSGLVRILGDTVNVAARIESAAPAGGVAISTSAVNLYNGAVTPLPNEDILMGEKTYRRMQITAKHGRIISVYGQVVEDQPTYQPLDGRRPDHDTDPGGPDQKVTDMREHHSRSGAAPASGAALEDIFEEQRQAAGKSD